MKPCYWLLLALAGAVGCGSQDTGTTSGFSSSGGDDEDDEDSADEDDGDNSKGPGKRDASAGGSGRTSPTTGGGAGGFPSSDDDDDACYVQPVSVTPNSPDILIVLDRSSSMVQGVDRWGPSIRAVEGLTTTLSETVGFGLMVFPALNPMGRPPGFDWTVFVDPATYLDPAVLADPNTYIQISCDPGEVNIPVDLNTADEISQFLATAAPDIGATPTSASLAAALTELDQPCADCGNRQKFVLLVTDGAPTCGAGGTITTDEDIAATVTAIDALAQANIKTYVVGFGTASDAVAAGAMDQFAQHGGTEHHFPVEDEAALIAELTQIAGALVPCEYELQGPVEDPLLLNVTIDEEAFPQGVDWTYDPDANKIILDPNGGACPVLRDAKIHRLKITQECEPPIIM